MSSRYYLAMGWLGVIIIIIIILLACSQARGVELWKITAYCSCFKCCNKTDGITASGRKAKSGYVACNWLKFGTRLVIDGNSYTVQDRGAKSLFGTKAKPIKHIDIWMASHKAARQYGVKYMPVKILK